MLAFDVSAPSYIADFTELRNRSGRYKSGGRFAIKKIHVAGYLHASDFQEYKNKESKLYGLLMDERGYYLTQVLHTSDLYAFELPGQKQGDINLLSANHQQAKIRYRVLNFGEINFDFVGKTPAGLLYKFAFNFETMNLPYGETMPKTLKVSGSYIPYKGTAVNSQLESPWTLKLTATANQPGDFTVKVGNKVFRHTSKTSVNSGDVFKLKGVETWLNNQNINDYTNYEYFELTPSLNDRVAFATNFKGNIEIENFIEFYK